MNKQTKKNGGTSDKVEALVSALDYALDMWQGYAHDAFKDLKKGKGFEAKKYRKFRSSEMKKSFSSVQSERLEL